MTRYYCDVCGVELTPKNSPLDTGCSRVEGSVKIHGKSMLIQIITGLNGIWNVGIFCNRCILKAVNALAAKRGVEP